LAPLESVLGSGKLLVAALAIDQEKLPLRELEGGFAFKKHKSAFLNKETILSLIKIKLLLLFNTILYVFEVMSVCKYDLTIKKGETISIR
jgi:hypothetical protein